MITIHKVEDISNAGFQIDRFIEQLVVDALANGKDVFVNNKKQLIARSNNDKEEVLAVFL